MNNSIIKLSENPKGFHDKADELTADMFTSNIPVQHSHDYYCDENIGLYVGLWDTEDMVEMPGPYGMEEFMVVLDGQANIKNNQTGTIDTVNAGESFVIPKGFDCQWQQQGYLKKFYVIFDNEKYAPGNENVDSITRFTPDNITSSFDNQQKTFYAGITHSTEHLMKTDEYRFVYVLSGSLTLSSNKAEQKIYCANEAIFIQKLDEISGCCSTDFSCYFCNVALPALN